jgi:hypothetical protein
MIQLRARAGRIRRRVRFALRITPAVLLAPLRLLPDFIVIGAQKAGTSSLYQYLARHPLIARAFRKEVHYFDNGCRGGRLWYQAHFPTRFAKWNRKSLLTGEATPKYLFEPAVPERVRELLPDVRLIAVLRNPVDRAYSEYHMIQHKYGDLDAFEKHIERELERAAGLPSSIAWRKLDRSIFLPRINCILRGLYADQLLSWLDFFPREQLLILNSERLFSDPQAGVDRVFSFLGLPPHTLDGFPIVNGGSYSRMEPETRRRMLDFYRPHNERLFELLGERYDWDQ